MTDKTRMKVILLGKGQMLANMIEAARESDVEIVGVFRYERTLFSGVKLFLNDLFKSSYDLTLIKKYKLPEVKCKSANSEDFRNYVLKTNADLIMVGTWREKLKKETFTMPRIGTVNIHMKILIQVQFFCKKRLMFCLLILEKSYEKGCFQQQEN